MKRRRETMADAYANIPDKESILKQEEELEKKNKWMYPVLITVLILVFGAGFIYGIQLVLNMEGAFPPAILTESRTPAPESDADLISYINAVIAEAEEEKPALSSAWELNIDGDSIETTGSDTLKTTLGFLADHAEDRISDGVEKQNTAFGEDISGALRVPELSESDIESFTCDYIYYKCTGNGCGQESAEPKDSCEVCGNDSPYAMRYRDNYTITVELKNTQELSDRLFGPSKEEVETLFTPSLEGFAEMKKLNSDTSRLCIQLVTDRKTDQLKRLTYRKEAGVSGSIAFTGEYASLGEADCSADITEETVFAFTWPALVFNKHEITLAPGKKDQITAERICDDPKAYTITWASSDESVVTVDGKGFVKAGKQPGSATVTASFEYQGKTYTDSCDIKVKISVQYIQLNKHKAALKPGESVTLKARVASDNKGFALKKPTIQTVTWSSSDESVAKVDENGTVTAVSPGTATIFVFSDDEWYRASCEVTVNE